MTSTRNCVGESVFIRDDLYEWLPAVITELDLENDRALVETKLPDTWKKHTVLVNEDSDGALNQQKWVTLSDYPRHKLPRRSDIIVRDMADIPHLHEATMLYQIKERHAQQKPYTRVGEIVVAVNPCRWIPELYSQETQKAYACNLVWNHPTVEAGISSSEEKKDDDTNTRTSPTSFGGVYDRLGYEPHVYEVSALAYRGLVMDKKDQAIFVSGESGAGKTETVKIVLKHLARLPEWGSNYSGSDHSSHTMVDNILESIPLFEAFGNAKTKRNHNSSRFAKVTNLQFSEDENKQMSFLTGIYTEAHLLEKSRVVSQFPDERNFHVFYQLLSASAEEKEELLGEDWRNSSPCDFRYLVTTSNDASHQNDLKDWENTLHALQFFGWNNEELKSLIQALGVLLRLGNISFTDTTDGEAVIDNRDELQKLSKDLGVSTEALEKAMTSKRIKVVDDEVDVPLPSSQAKECCDALAKIIYSRLFEVLADRINKKTHVNDHYGSRVISLLDMFGFESFDTNGFDQLCVNYSNEKLQQKYVHDNILRLTKEYRDEGITLFDIDSIDNACTVALFENTRGIITVLDDECLRPNGTDESFVYKLKGTSRALIENNLHTKTEFSIHHYAGPVAYDAKGFIERNSDKLPRDVILVASKSSNGIIRSELMQLIREEEMSLRTKKRKTSIMQKFQVQLHSLLDNMSNMQVRYIRCIKPNDFLEASRTDHLKTLQQIKCAGLVTAIEMGRKTFPDKLSFSLIEQRFSCLLSSDYQSMLKDIPLHDRACLMMTFIFANYVGSFDDDETGLPYACGKTNIYFRAGAVEHLESLRRSLFSNKATVLQAWYRAKTQLRKYSSLRRSVVFIQACNKSRKQRLQYLTLKSGILRLQAVYFSCQLRILYEKKRGAAVAVQRCYRLLFARRNAVFRIQSWFRHRIAERLLARRCHAALMLQSLFRARFSKTKVNRLRCAALKLTSFVRMALVRRRYAEARQASRTRLCTTQEFGHDKAHMPITKDTQNHFEAHCGFVPEAEMEATHHDENRKAIRDEMCTIDLTDNEKTVCRYCNHLRHDDSSVNRQRIRDLRQEIVHVTEEAELHNRLVEAEFEERIADYESEVLQLQNNVAYLEAEKSALLAQIDTVQLNYTKTIQLLQRGMRDTTNSHKEYLAKIMSQLERSNEQRKAETARFSEELHSMKLSSDAKIQALEKENNVLRNALDEHERLRQFVSEKTDVMREMQRLLRKMEKLLSPQQILLAIDYASNDACQRHAVIEKHISAKCRKTLYHLEDLIMHTLHTRTSNGFEAEIIGLQNQLVRAYEDKEQLQEEIALLRSTQVHDRQT
ncbi:hypothetical protein FisN_25Hh113 [Fistulifera solaris]|uniref:Myosin motor domain-containing protein n=1 Tax=Fistulifera solaris TaxID=1519565 RepID=A0A1Z5JWL3_FISSO|nr:hypothetical protein FisN_25Hh113 [Fistulifera solaris]|eukprot:GAX18131.1 hypothetical protein FisN_25Hh113 [Fistulifera solaris]